MKQPTANEVIASIKKWGKRAGVRVTVDGGATTRGRRWSYGINGVVEHHWAGVGDGGLQWMAARDGSYPYCNAAVRRSGEIVVLSALSAWGSGVGGPWPAAGVPKDVGHLYLWQTEYESWGKQEDFTDEMWKAQAALDCAIREVSGEDQFPDFSRLINHRGWTDGGPELGLDYWLPSRWRKNDTLYDIERFRVNAQSLWDQFATPKKPTVRVRDVQPGSRNDSVVLVKRALIEEGLLRRTDRFGKRFGGRAQKAYRTWQRMCGLRQLEANGVPDLKSLRRLGKRYGWRTEN